MKKYLKTFHLFGNIQNNKLIKGYQMNFRKRFVKNLKIILLKMFIFMVYKTTLKDMF